MEFLFLDISRIYIFKNISCTKEYSFLGGAYRLHIESE